MKEQLVSTARKKIAIACQGGGSQTAFTAGALKGLFEERVHEEFEIVSLAASGLTNKQIAERLFLSHRTVGGHLHRAFPKLGVTTRAALRDALASVPRERLPH